MCVSPSLEATDQRENLIFSHHQRLQRRSQALHLSLSIYPEPKLRPIISLVQSLVRPPLEAEEIASEISLKCLEQKISPTRTLIRNHVIDKLRHLRTERDVSRIQARSIVVVSELEQDDETSLSILLKEDQNFLSHLATKARVSAEDMILVYLRFYREMTHREIGERLGVIQKDSSYSEKRRNMNKVSRKIQDILSRLRNAYREV